MAIASFFTFLPGCSDYELVNRTEGDNTSGSELPSSEGEPGYVVDEGASIPSYSVFEACFPKIACPEGDENCWLDYETQNQAFSNKIEAAASEALSQNGDNVSVTIDDILDGNVPLTVFSYMYENPSDTYEDCCYSHNMRVTFGDNRQELYNWYQEFGSPNLFLDEEARNAFPVDYLECRAVLTDGENIEDLQHSYYRFYESYNDSPVLESLYTYIAVTSIESKAVYLDTQELDYSYIAHEGSSYTDNTDESYYMEDSIDSLDESREDLADTVGMIHDENPYHGDDFIKETKLTYFSAD